jgi:hypothetical protein
MEELGISRIVLVSSQEDGEVIVGGATAGGDLGGDMSGMGALGGGGAGAAALGAGETSEGAASDSNGTTEEVVTYKAKKYSFVVQFCWVPTEPIKRLAAQQLAAQQAQDAIDAAQTPVGGPNGNPGGDPNGDPSAGDPGDPGDLGPDDNGPPID